MLVLQIQIRLTEISGFIRNIHVPATSKLVPFQSAITVPSTDTAQARALGPRVWMRPRTRDLKAKPGNADLLSPLDGLAGLLIFTIFP